MLKDPVSRRQLAIALATMLASLALNWWIRPGPQVLEGRWYRVEPVLSEIDFGSYPAGAQVIGDPMPTLPTLEFRPDGSLLALARAGMREPMIADRLGYALRDDQLEITGRCWQGRVPSPCTKAFRYTLVNDRLTIESWIYARQGPVSDPPPPALPVPMPSATP